MLEIIVKWLFVGKKIIVTWLFVKSIYTQTLYLPCEDNKSKKNEKHAYTLTQTQHLGVGFQIQRE